MRWKIIELLFDIMVFTMIVCMTIGGTVGLVRYYNEHEAMKSKLEQCECICKDKE